MYKQCFKRKSSPCSQLDSMNLLVSLQDEPRKSLPPGDFESVILPVEEVPGIDVIPTNNMNTNLQVGNIFNLWTYSIFRNFEFPRKTIE